MSFTLATDVDLNRCLKQIKLMILRYTRAPIPKLSTNTSTMAGIDRCSLRWALLGCVGFEVGCGYVAPAPAPVLNIPPLSSNLQI